MSMLDEDEEYEDEVLHERRGTSVLRSAPPELVVPTPWMCRRWTGALNSRLWPRACAETGKRASMWQSRGPRFSGRCLGWFAKAPEEIRIDSVKAWRACDNKVCFFGNRNGTLQWEHVPVAGAGHYIQPDISSDIAHVVRFTCLAFQLNVILSAALGGSIKMRVVVLWAPRSEEERQMQDLKVRNAFSYLLMPAMPWK